MKIKLSEIGQISITVNDVDVDWCRLSCVRGGFADACIQVPTAGGIHRQAGPGHYPNGVSTGFFYQRSEPESGVVLSGLCPAIH